MANTVENEPVQADAMAAAAAEAASAADGTGSAADGTGSADDDLMELEFTPLPPQEAAELEDRVYLLGARHGVRPF